jgi:hypothetical protein
MSIERFGGLCIPVCDRCGSELPAETDFYDAVSAKKAAGWRSRKVDDRWEDICDACLADETNPKNIFTGGRS